MKTTRVLISRKHGNEENECNHDDKHEVFTETIDKISLSTNNDNRIIREDTMSTFTHGHYHSAARLEELINEMNKKYES